jgi:D-3-phosphoglycerate dehydrogenase / 2-oxoglutarate reductase
MKHVLIATEKPFARVAVKEITGIFSKAGYDLKYIEGSFSKTEFTEAIKNTDALIVRSDLVDRQIIETANNLKIVVRAGSGFDNLDLKACTEKGIVAMNTPGQNSNAVAELTVGMMIFMSRGQFTGRSGSELKGKTIGIYGLGNIGQRVAQIVQGFGMRVLALHPDKSGLNDVYVVQSVEDLFANSDYLTLHIPANEKTYHSVNFELMNRLPREALLVNTARKEIIDEPDLKRMFEERPDFKYITDISPSCHEEFSTKYGLRYFATSKKQGSETAEANLNAGVAAARQIVLFFEQGDLTYQING